MQNSKELVKQACNGIRPQRMPIFDIFTHDKVVEHFAGRPFDGINDEQIAIDAVGNGLDGARWMQTPDEDGRTWTDDMGNLRKAARWTEWIEKHALTDVAGWAAWIKTEIERIEAEPELSEDQITKTRQDQADLNARLNGTDYIHCTPSTAINGILFGYHCGLEFFSYLWVDHRDLILAWIRAIEKQQQRYIAQTATTETASMVMIYSDVAYNQALMLSRQMFDEIGFFDDVAAICDACHQRSLKVVFHSDGYVMEIMDDLVAAGIDGFNPIDKVAGMDIYELRRRYPELIMVGGVDVKGLLLQGTPDEIRTETRRIINEVGSQGRLLIGSTTEVSDNVPLENYLAFHNEVMGN